MSGKNKNINNKKQFKEFQQIIEDKYGYMAEEILFFFYDFKDFFSDNKIDITGFNVKHVGPLFEDYLNYENLCDSECAMLFQMLIDFCDFCQNKKIEYDFFKDYLKNEKDLLYENWSVHEVFDINDEDVKNLISEEKPPDINPEDIMNNFDSWYDVIRMSLKNKTLDISKVLDFLTQTYTYVEYGFSKSLEIQKKYPHLPIEKLRSKIDDAIENNMVHLDNIDKVYESVYLLPKEQVRKFMTIVFLMEEKPNYEFGSSEHKKTVDEFLEKIEDLIDDVKKINEKETK